MGLLNKQKLFEKGQKILCCTNVALKESNVSKKHKGEPTEIFQINLQINLLAIQRLIYIKGVKCF